MRRELQSDTGTPLRATSTPRPVGATVRPLCEIQLRGPRYVLDITEDAEGRTVTLSVGGTGLRLFQRGRAQAAYRAWRNRGGDRPA